MEREAAAAVDLRRREGGGAKGVPWKEESSKEGLWSLVVRVEAMEAILKNRKTEEIGKYEGCVGKRGEEEGFYRGFFNNVKAV